MPPSAQFWGVRGRARCPHPWAQPGGAVPSPAPSKAGGLGREDTTGSCPEALTGDGAGGAWRERAPRAPGRGEAGSGKRPRRGRFLAPTPPRRVCGGRGSRAGTTAILLEDALSLLPRARLLRPGQDGRGRHRVPPASEGLEAPREDSGARGAAEGTPRSRDRAPSSRQTPLSHAGSCLAGALVCDAGVPLQTRLHPLNRGLALFARHSARVWGVYGGGGTWSTRCAGRGTARELVADTGCGREERGEGSTRDRVLAGMRGAEGPCRTPRPGKG